MATDTSSDSIDDVRWSQLCSAFDDLMNQLEMQNWERINMGGRLIASIVKALPVEQRFRWFAFVMHELSSESADLNVSPIVKNNDPIPSNVT